MFLVATALTKFWSGDETLLFLGPWCARYDRKKDWQNRHHVMLKNPWDDRERLYRAALYCERVFNHLMKELAEYLNTVHSTNYHQRYWRIVVGPWLLYYTHCMYGRYTYLKCAAEAYPMSRIICLSEADFTTPRDMRHFTALLDNELYNLQLFSMLCSGLKIKCSTLRCSGEDRNSLSRSGGEQSDELIEAWGAPIKKRLRDYLWAITDSICIWSRRPIVIVDQNFGLVHQASWNLLPRGMTGISNNWNGPDVPSEAVFNESRQGLASLSANDEFTQMMVATLARNFPIVYLEGYRLARRKSLCKWDYVPRVCASAAWFLDEAFKYVAAQWSEKGCCLVGIQHGGGYGTAKYVTSEWHERNICDRYYSWGWSIQDLNGRVRNVPAPLLSAASDRVPRSLMTVSQVLLVATNFALYPFKLDSQPQGSQIEEHINWRIQFINALQGHPRDNLVVRLASDDGWCQKQRLGDACGPLQFDDSSASLQKQFRRTRLAVFDHQTTTHLEALALNIPCILFWQPDRWEIRQEAAQFYSALSECGILFDDPEKAADKVMSVYENPMIWWSSEPVQTARKAFVDRYADGREDWVSHWVKALEEEMDLSQVHKE